MYCVADISCLLHLSKCMRLALLRYVNTRVLTMCYAINRISVLILLSMTGLCTYVLSLDVPILSIEGATFQVFTDAAARGAELHDKMAAACLVL